MAARSRSVSVPWFSVGLFVGLVAAVWLGHVAAFWLVQQLPLTWMFAIGTELPTVVPALLAYLVVAFVAHAHQGAIRRAVLNSFAVLGIPLEFEARFEVLPEGLRVSTDRITIFPRWAAVDTIECATDGWAISADQLTFFLPSDSFADETAERAFVTALVGHLSAEARGRSAKAIAFIETGAALAAGHPGAALTAPVQEPADALTARALITRQEAGWAGRAAYDRVAHTGRHAFLYPALSALVGGMLGLVAAGLVLLLAPLSLTLGNAMAFAGMTFLLPLLGSAAGLWIGYRALGRIVDKAYHAGLSARGSPAAAECEWELAAEGLVLRSSRGTTVARWDAVSDLFRADAYWVVLSDVAATAIPRRAFADEAAERAFIASLLERMAGAARERSGDAAAFVASAGSPSGLP